ncbi:MAG TPA: insulinase family protein [Streptosporangiaceae bacterium]|nr:insulinase family protein [Streptosporangiaceae bacterium]
MDYRYTCAIAFAHRLPDASGVAHVVEHLVAHGPRDRGARYLLPELTDHGLLDSFTGLTYRGFTGYVMTGGAMAMEAAVELVSQSCLNPAMDSAAIAVERGRLAADQWRPGVVEDEVELRRNWLRDAVSAATGAVHADDALGHDPAGRSDLLRALTDDDVRSFHRRWYAAESMIICRAIEGEPFELGGGDERPRWIWQPRVRHAAVPIERGQGTEPGGGSPAEHALCWRAGVFPQSRRESNLLVARCICAALGSRELRERLAEAGWIIAAGPIVDSTLPDPCVIAVLKESARGAGTTASEAVNELLRSVALDQAGLSGLRKRAENLTEPVVPEPWAARAVLALAAGLAGGLPGEEPSDEEVGSAIRQCASDRSGPAGRLDRQRDSFAVRAPSAEVRAPSAKVRVPSVRNPNVSSKVREQAGQLRRSSAQNLENSDTGRFGLVVGTDSRCWPGHRTTISIRFYPAAGETGCRKLAALPGLWPARAAVAAPRLHVSGNDESQRPFAEWVLPGGNGQIGAALSRLAGAMESLGERPAVDRRPSAPDPFLVAASLAGSAQARSALALSGHVIAGQVPLRHGAAPATDDYMSIGVTGAGPVSADELRSVAREAAGRVQAAFAGLSAEATSQTRPQIRVRRDDRGHWWLDTTGQPLLTAPLTVHAIQPFWPGAGSLSRGDLMPYVRQAMRDSGCYAVEGRVIDDWQLAVFTVYRPQADKLAGSRLADAIIAAAASLGDRRRANRPAMLGPPPGAQPPGATPQAAAEALQRYLNESSPVASGDSQSGPVVPPPPSVLLASSAGHA